MTKQTFLREIEAAKSDDGVIVRLKNRSVNVRVESDGELNDDDFSALVNGDDVSLSSDEIDKLDIYLREVARQ